MTSVDKPITDDQIRDLFGRHCECRTIDGINTARLSHSHDCDTLYTNACRTALHGFVVEGDEPVAVSPADQLAARRWCEEAIRGGAEDSALSDREEACGACCFVADDFGDNTATMRCQLAPGHEGSHQEMFDRDGGPVTVTWVADERVKCDHGCGHWESEHHEEHVGAACPKYQDDHEWSDCGLCNPGTALSTCSTCGKTYYEAGGHAVHCGKKTTS